MIAGLNASNNKKPLLGHGGREKQISLYKNTEFPRDHNKELEKKPEL